MQKTIHSLIVGSSIIFYSALTYADAKLDFYYQRQLKKTASYLKEPSTKAIAEKYYEQLIDHNHPELGTFKQRYYIDETYSTSNQSPVFFYICGESECHSSEITRGALRTLAAKFKAKIVALEHRYYGTSLPRKTFSTESLKYLTTDFALKDLASFQKHLRSSLHWTGKWFAIGGSYSGSLSAYYRMKYPELISGSLASSAPVRAKENFEEYDAHVTNVAGPRCAANMRAAVYEVEAAMQSKNPARLNEIKRMFAASEVKNNVDFVDLIAEIGAIAIQYGMKDDFCNSLMQSNTPLNGYASFAQHIYSGWNITPLNLIPQGAESEDPQDYRGIFGLRQWLYQSCTEYGYWQNANADPNKSTRSSLINSTYAQEICFRLFGIKQKADTDRINNNFYRPLFNESVSNIFFTNGSRDPWSTLSLIDANGNTTNPKLSYYLIEGASHCDDLRTPTVMDSASLKTARAKFNSLLMSWLRSDERK